jgi:hypothetical protein
MINIQYVDLYLEKFEDNKLYVCVCVAGLRNGLAQLTR